MGVERLCHPWRGCAPFAQGLGEVQMRLGSEGVLDAAPVHMGGELLEKPARLALVLHALDGAERGMGPALALQDGIPDAALARLPGLALTRTGEQGAAPARLLPLSGSTGTTIAERCGVVSSRYDGGDDAARGVPVLDPGEGLAR